MVRRDVSVSPRTGKEHEFVVLESRDWVMAVAFDRDDRLVMVRQYRHGWGDVTLECPGGIVGPGYDALEAAQAELLEETGHAGGEWTRLGRLAAVPAVFNNTLHVFLARGVARVSDELDLDEGEDIRVELHPYRAVRQMMERGDIIHAQVVAAFFLYELWREANGPAGGGADSKEDGR
jgi:8-oxo-dGTP pyrophosphatase MutT (NUDIX family)